MYYAKFRVSNLKGTKEYNKMDVNLQIWSRVLDHAHVRDMPCNYFDPRKKGIILYTTR